MPQHPATGICPELRRPIVQHSRPAPSGLGQAREGAVRLRVSDSESARDLGEFLRDRIGAVVDASRAERGLLEVSVLGSFGERAMREELDAAVRQWTLVRQQPESAVVFE